MPIKLHFAGSLPKAVAPDPRTGMKWVLDRIRGRALTAMACDLDSSWIVDQHLRNLAERPHLEIALDGDYSTYDSARTYQPVRHRKTGKPVDLTPDDLSMRRVDKLLDALSTFRRMRQANAQLKGLRYQVSLPSPLDLTLFTFGRIPYLPGRRMPRLLQALPGIPAALRALKHLSVYCEAQRRDVAALCAEGAKDIVFNIESPAILVALDLVPRPLRRFVASLLARQLADFIASLPAEALLRLHLCNSNHGDLALFHPKNLRNPVLFLNVLARELQRRYRPLPEADIPAAVSNEPPPSDPAYYKPLAKLNPEYRVVAGVVDEHHPVKSVTAFRLFRAALRRPPVGAMTACGLGRHSAEDAERAVEVMIKVVDDANEVTDLAA